MSCELDLQARRCTHCQHFGDCLDESIAPGELIVHGYTEAERTAIMAAHGHPAEVRCCPLCGRTDLPVENAHMLPRSIGGEDGPTNPLCKCCHAAHDAYEWKPVPANGGELWYALVASVSFAAYLSRHRGHPINRGFRYPLIFIEGR